MRAVLVLAKRLFAFSAGDVIVFGGVAAIVMIVSAGLGLPPLGMAAAGLSWLLGWALGRVMDLYHAAHRENGPQEEWLERSAVLEVAPTDFDGLGS